MSGTSGRRSPGFGVGGAKKNKITASLSDHSASQIRGIQSPAPGRGEQTGEAARLPQATLCLLSSEAATKPPTRTMPAAPLLLRRRTPSPTGSPLPAMFLGCFVPHETPDFSPSASGENRAPASKTGTGPCPIPWQRRETPEPRLGHRPPFVVPRGRGCSLRPDGTPAPTAAPTRARRCLGSSGNGSGAPRSEPALRGMRSPPAAPLLAPALPRSPSLSLTHAVLLVLRGYPHARGVRAPFPPPAPPPGAAVAGKRVRCPGLPPRSAAAARPRRRRHCSGGRTD